MGAVHLEGGEGGDTQEKGEYSGTYMAPVTPQINDLMNIPGRIQKSLNRSKDWEEYQ